MHRFLKYNVNHLGVGRSCQSNIIFSRSSGIELVRPKIPYLLRDNLRFTFSLLLIFLNSLIFINSVHKLTHTSNRFTGQWFPQSCSLGRSILKVLMTTFSKSPSISLYISQYLSEYAFRVSPSCMDRDSSESKGLGTLLHVTKREPKDCASSVKEFMELAFNP